MLELSRLSVGGFGVDSLLEALLEAAGFAFALPLPKKSFAVDGWEGLLSCFTAGLFSLTSAVLGFTAAFAGAGAGAGAAATGGGRRAGLLLTFLLVIVPYIGACSTASSEAQRT